MEVWNGIIGIDLIMGLVLELVISLIGWIYQIVNERYGRTLVPEYESQIGNNNQMIWTMRFLQTVWMPMACVVLPAYELFLINGGTFDGGEAIVVLIAFGVVLTSICYLCAVMKKEWFIILLKLLLTSVFCQVVFIVCVRLIAPWRSWSISMITITLVQISCFHVILYKEEHYDQYAGKHFQKAEYLISVGMACAIIYNSLVLYWVGVVVSGALTLFDKRNRRACDESPIEKKIICQIAGSDRNECIAIGKIRTLSEGLCIEKGAGQREYVPYDSVSKIVFDTQKKQDKLSKQVDYIEDMTGTNVLPEGRWYLRMNPKGWLWICRWDENHTKNIIYSTKNIRWGQSKKC